MRFQLITAIRILIRLLRYFIISVLSLDLLYLYYSGGWYDRIKLIETIELIILWVLAFAGLAGLIYQTKCEVKKRFQSDRNFFYRQASLKGYNF